jgi:hypothetical protein
MLLIKINPFLKMIRLLSGSKPIKKQILRQI